VRGARRRGGTDAATRRSPARRGSRRLAFDLTALSVVGLLLVGAIGAATATVYRDLYSPGAFVTRYLDLLSQGRVPEALALPGVPIASSDLTDAGLPADASEALLRRAALAPLSDIRVVGEQESDGVDS
jgi:hypothetical protein